AEAVDADGLALAADVLVPERGDARLDRDALAAGLRQDGLAVLVALLVEAQHRRHGYDARAGAELLGGLDRVLHLGAGGHQDDLERGGLLLDDVAALENAAASFLGGYGVDVRHVLA